MNLGKAFLNRVTFIVVFISIIAAPNVYPRQAQPTAEQQRTEERLKQQFPNTQVIWNSRLKTPVQIKGIRSEPLILDREAILVYFVDNFSVLYQIQAPDREIQAGDIRTASEGASVLSLYQKHEDIPVYGVSLGLRLDRARRLQSISGKWIPAIEVDITPTLGEKQAADSIVAYLRDRYTGPTPLPDEVQLEPESIKLVIFNPVIYGESQPSNHLAYHVIVKTQVFFVDAHTGEVLHTYSNIQRSRDRNTHTSDDCFQLPGDLIINEAGPTGGATPDSQTQNAHDFAGMVYDYFSSTHGRDSYDGSGSTIVSTVHSGVPIDPISLLFCCLFGLDCCGCIDANAAWIPTLDQMVYGDGGTLDDGRAFNPFTDALDVVAHEITHGVTQHSIFDIDSSPVGLDYTGQSGALNESFSDFFGAMVDRDDWLMGEDLVTAGYPAGAMRNLADPTNGGSYDPGDPEGSVKAGHQPDHMDNYVSGGDVHINSGIPNKVGYLMATGGQHPHSGVEVRGIGREATEKILYDTLANRLNQTATFLEARAASLDAVQDLFPGSDFNYTTVWNAFVACGICDPAIPSHCDPRAYPTSFNWLDIFDRIFGRSSEVTLFRQYRDEFLVKTEQGKRYATLLYRNSDEVLKVLVDNPEWIAELRFLIDANESGVVRVLERHEGVIYNTDSIISFLGRFAERSPLALKALANEVRDEMIESRKDDELFLGFRLR